MIKMKVMSPDLILTFDLQKSEPVAHPDTLSVLIEEDSTTDKKLWKLNKLEPDILAFSDTFFHNTEKGTIVSVEQQPDGEYHIRGHLTHTVTIAPSALPGRSKRAIHEGKTHTLYSVPEDRDRDMADSDSLRLALGNSLLNEVGKKDSKEWARMKKLNSILTEWSQEEKESLEEEAEVDLEDDYLEVPPIFDSEEAWKAHQSQAEANFNSVHEKDDEEHDTSSLMFHKSDHSHKNNRIRKRRKVTPDSDRGRKQVSDPHRVTISVDRSFPIQRRFQGNVNQGTAANTLKIIKVPKSTDKESIGGTKSGKVDIEILSLDNESSAKAYDSGILTEPVQRNKVAYDILYDNFVPKDKGSQRSKDNPTFLNNDDNKPQRRSEIPKIRLPVSRQHKTHRRRRQISPDTKDVPKVSHERPTGNTRRGNTDFVVEVIFALLFN
ncbi:hypothetical protein ElyMa_000829800 [Elysia marginata]|uniref:Uncharacterized protein n=1 Tax=Elysia marginata TaxID=1093978 RepID=A0AAV4H116_9GAST|nr:hypothetical protein ElyMa_000829800 [Elysia marginata]